MMFAPRFVGQAGPHGYNRIRWTITAAISTGSTTLKLYTAKSLYNGANPIDDSDLWSMGFFWWDTLTIDSSSYETHTGTTIPVTDEDGFTWMMITSEASASASLQIGSLTVTGYIAE